MEKMKKTAICLSLNSEKALSPVASMKLLPLAFLTGTFGSVSA